MSVVRILSVFLPALEVILGVVEDLSGGASMFVHPARIAWRHWGVVEKGQQTLPVSCKDDLLLGTLDDGRKLSLIRFS